MSDNTINFDYIIYHKNCLDGFSGFLVANMSGKLTKDCTVYPDVPSANMVPPDINGKTIVIIDVAYKKEILEHIFKLAKYIVFIDHHVSIKDDTRELHKKYNRRNNIEIIYDEVKCGSTLAWLYFFGTAKMPLFLKYIEDQDTGKWIHKNTKPFIFALKSYYKINDNKKYLKKWYKLLEKDNVKKLIKKGKYMEKYNNHLIATNISKYTLERFPSKKLYNYSQKHSDTQVFSKIGQYKVAVYCGFNCPSITDLGTAVLDTINCDFCIMWIYNLDSKKYVLSMRSRITDVSQICKIFGGGGHKLAAACSFNSSMFILDDLFEGSSLPRQQ